MKKILILVLLFGVISTSIDLKTDINVFEDEVILRAYERHLEGINIEDFLPSISSFNFIVNTTDSNVGLKFNNKLEINNIDFDIKNSFDFNDINIANNNQDNISELIFKLDNDEFSNLFINNNTDKEKFNEFKNELVIYAKSKIKETGFLENPKYISNSDETEMLNSSIEIELY